MPNYVGYVKLREPHLSPDARALQTLRPLAPLDGLGAERLRERRQHDAVPRARRRRCVVRSETTIMRRHFPEAQKRAVHSPH